jgi:hypothetical protein
MSEHFYQTGDLVVLTNRDYKYINAGAVGIVTSTNGNLINVALPQGTWAFPKWELKPLTKETSCK